MLRRTRAKKGCAVLATLRAMAVLPHEGTYPILYGPFAVPVGSGYRRSYLARPDQAGRFPVVVVLHDLDGLDAHEKDLCRRLARQGFAAICLELYEPSPSGTPPERRTERGLEGYHRLDDATVLADLDETVEFLASDDVEWAFPSPIGLFAIDVGGRLAVMVAAHRSYVGSLAIAYAPLTGDEERRFPVAKMLDHLGCPVLAIYGEKDELIPTETVDEAQRRNPAGRWLLFEGAGHGFLDASSPAFQPAAADDALARVVAHLRSSLPMPVLTELG